MGELLNREQIEDLEQKISQLPTIKKHDDDIKEIIVDLEGLKEGQRTLNIKVDEMGKGLIEVIKELGISIAKKIDEKEIGELKTEIRTLKKRDEKDEAKKWDLAKIFLASATTAIIAYIVYLTKGQ